MLENVSNSFGERIFSFIFHYYCNFQKLCHFKKKKIEVNYIIDAVMVTGRQLQGHLLEVVANLLVEMAKESVLQGSMMVMVIFSG